MPEQEFFRAIADLIVCFVYGPIDMVVEKS